MYNRLVTTLVILVMVSAFSSAAHAQYYTRSYSPGYTFGSSAYGHSIAAADSSYASVFYSGRFRGPVFYPVKRTPSYFNFAYASQPVQAPLFQPVQRTPSSFNYQFRPTYFQPTYGPGLNFGSINFRPAYFQPTYGPGLNLGSIGLNLGPRPIPDFGGRLNFGPYNFYAQPIAPIYETPSRALFNTEFHYRSFMGPYWY